MNKRNYCKLRKKASVLVVLVAVIFQLFSILPVMQVRAADITNKVQFITEVTLTNSNGDPINESSNLINKSLKPINESSNTISKNAEVTLNYKFVIPNKGEIKKGDNYTIQIPKEIKIIKKLNFPIITDNGDTIAKVTIDTNGKVNMIFTEFVENNSNISGFFYINTQFNPDEIEGPSPVPIEFDLGGKSEPYIINVNFEQHKVPKASVKKEGKYDASKNEITWKVIVNPEGVKVNKAQIVDNISQNQEFVQGSVNINGANAKAEDYSYDSKNKKLTYNFPRVIETEQIITFKTKVKSEAFKSEGETLYEYNTATFNHDGTTVKSNKAYVDIYTDFIRKDGKYDEATRRINWTINVNNNAQSIPNAVVTDNIPSGLTFTKGSLKVDGKTINKNYTIEGQKFTYTFPVVINEPHKIEFSTDVKDDSVFNSNKSKTYDNKVTLTGDGVPGNASDNKSVEVTTSIIYKQGKGYNAATGEITWEIIVNRNNTPIKNPVVTDEIPLGQEYVDGSATIDKKVPKGRFNYVKAVNGDSKKTGTLTYSFNGDINETYVLTFKTKVTDPKVYAGNRYEAYYNTAKLTGDNIKPSTSEGYEYVLSYVIYKECKGYDYVTREFTWQVRVNINGITLPNAYVTDVIGKGQKVVPNSVMLNGKPAKAKNYTYDEATKTLRYNFPSEIKEEQVITFKTKISDDSVFNSNGQKKFENTAKLITDLVPEGVESTGTKNIKSNLINKTAKYERGNSYIDWNVTFNSNKILIKDAVLTDTLQEGLELDTTSVKLYKQNLNTNGTLSKGEEVPLKKDSVKYNPTTREFNFTLPSSTNEVYMLTFRTDVVDKKKSPFTNAISFKGTGIKEQANSDKVNVIFQGAGGGGFGETGSIKVIKVDKTNENIKLQGAVFELLDKYQNVIKTSEATGKNGEVIFDKLKFDVDYYVREKVAPVGYVLSDELYKFQIKGTQDEKNIVYKYKNEKIKGNILITKTDMHGKLLQGAEFTVKNEAEKLIDKIANVLPKTGVLFDFKVMIVIGSLTILSGMTLLLKRKTSK